MNQPFKFPNGQLAYNADELLELCQQFPVDGTNYLVKKDLESWLSYIGKDDIAQYAASARQTALEDRQKLEEFLDKCHAKASPETPSSVSEIPEVTENIVVTESPTVKPEENLTSVVTQTPASVPEKPAIVTESPVVETQENPTSIVAEIPQTTSVNTLSPVATQSSPEVPTSKISESSSVSSNSSNQKPSFLQVIARLIVNVIYGNKS